MAHHIATPPPPPGESHARDSVVVPPPPPPLGGYVPPPPPPPVEQTKHDTRSRSDENRERFGRFHADNPSVCERMIDVALDLKANGHRKVGMQMLIEHLRWEYMVETMEEGA